MDTLSEHYERLLGLDEAWRVVDVDLRLEENRVEIRLKDAPGGRKSAKRLRGQRRFERVRCVIFAGSAAD